MGIVVFSIPSRLSIFSICFLFCFILYFFTDSSIVCTELIITGSLIINLRKFFADWLDIDHDGSVGQAVFFEVLEIVVASLDDVKEPKVHEDAEEDGDCSEETNHTDI